MSVEPVPNRIPIQSKALALIEVAKALGVHLQPAMLVKIEKDRSVEMDSSELIQLAGSVGLRATGLRPGWDGLRNLANSLPLIVNLKDGTAALLQKIENLGEADCLTIQDPVLKSNGLLVMSKKQFESIWNGEVIIFQNKSLQESTRHNLSLKSVYTLIAQEHSMLRDLCISAIMLSFLALVPILFFRIASDKILPYHALSTFSVICILVSLMAVFETAFGGLRRYLVLRITTRVDIKLTTEMFSRVLDLPVEYFERHPAGVTMHTMGQITRIRSLLVGQLFGALLDAGILLFFVPVMFIISPLLTAVVLFFAVLICAWIVCMLPLYKRKSGAVEAAESMRGAFLSQSIQGIRTIKSLALESRHKHEWDALTARIAHLRFAEGNLANLIQMVVTPLERLMVIGSFGIGVFVALSSSNVEFMATLATFLLLSQRLSTPLIQASQVINQYDEARSAVELVGRLVNQDPEQSHLDKGVRKEIIGHIEFSSICFSYKGARKPALNNVSFELPQGFTLGVMGRSGSGKTTITRLLQRLNSDYSGLLRVDGIDIRNYNLSHFRSSLGVVLQENFLFSGTIRSNIMMAKQNATYDDMVSAARLAGAEEFIDKFPNGYETYVYEGSPNLSGGQRQRLAIARALITDPKILILDEATSALDAESEAIVNANIERISQGRTVITISHRLASLVKADAILVMEQGEVNDIGKHHELLERNEIYANLWYTQNPHTAAPAAPRPQLTYRGPQSVA